MRTRPETAPTRQRRRCSSRLRSRRPLPAFSRSTSPRHRPRARRGGPDYTVSATASSGLASPSPPTRRARASARSPAQQSRSSARAPARSTPTRLATASYQAAPQVQQSFTVSLDARRSASPPRLPAARPSAIPPTPFRRRRRPACRSPSRPTRAAQASAPCQARRSPSSPAAPAPSTPTRAGTGPT